jgi:hypothetical protein
VRPLEAGALGPEAQGVDAQAAGGCNATNAGDGASTAVQEDRTIDDGTSTVVDFDSDVDNVLVDALHEVEIAVALAQEHNDTQRAQDFGQTRTMLVGELQCADAHPANNDDGWDEVAALLPGPADEDGAGTGADGNAWMPEQAAQAQRIHPGEPLAPLALGSRCWPQLAALSSRSLQLARHLAALSQGLEIIMTPLYVLCGFC